VSTDAAVDAISRGVSIVRILAWSRSSPARTASMNAR